MDRIRVRPGPPLSGRVKVAGAKNSVLKLMAACLLAEGRHRLTNVPRIVDVEIMAELLGAMGVVSTREAGGCLVVDVPADVKPEAPYELVEKMRASVVVLGPLLARLGRAIVSLPGGDDFGNRPIDFHLRGLEAMGTTFTSAHGYVDGRAGRLTGARIVLEFPSHTTTDNLMMAASLAKGTTTIENAAREPEVSDLAAYLNAMGARVSGAGTSRIVVEGVEALAPASHRVVADRVEAATFLAAVGMAGGEVLVEGARAEHMDMLVAKLGAMGLCISATDGGISATDGGISATDGGTSATEGGLLVSASGAIQPVDVATLPYPGVATDYKPLIVTMLSVADGAAIVTENLYPGRFRYVDELRRMGADIRTEGHHAVVSGVPRLSGAQVRAPDIRAGAALVLAGLRAEGETLVASAHHVDRGYEDLAGKLASLGADVTRIP